MAGPGRPRKIRPEDDAAPVEAVAPKSPRPANTFPMHLHLGGVFILVINEEEEAIAISKGFT